MQPDDLKAQMVDAGIHNHRHQQVYQLARARGISHEQIAEWISEHGVDILTGVVEKVLAAKGQASDPGVTSPPAPPQPTV